MKTKLTALLLTAVAALTLVPKPAQAGDKELALIGGFIGGLMIGSAINQSHQSAYGDHGTTIVVHDADYRDRGYWDYTTVRVWVPSCWETRIEFGRRTRIFIPGHYVIRRERVWVAHHGDRHDRHDRHGHRRGRRW